jgi:hypothetical protein
MVNLKTPAPDMSRLYTLLFILSFAIEPAVAFAQFVPTEIVFQNSDAEVTATHSRPGEFGDEIILGGDNRKILSFEFEYFGTFEPDGDETCVLRFYDNDGEALVGDDKAPGTILYQSEPFTIFPDFNTAALRNIEVEVPDKFTWTVEFAGLSGFSTDRAGLLLRDPPSIGRSFDDFWVHFGNGWATWRFNGDPVANFACRAISEFDLSISYPNLESDEEDSPLLTIQGPRNQTVIVWASNDLEEWEPIALQVLEERQFTLLDSQADPEKPRYYRSALVSNTPITMEDFKILPNGRTRLSVSGPRGIPFTVQASADFETWEDVFSLSFQTRPITIQDADAAEKGIRFYRILVNNVVVQNVNSIKEQILTFPDDFTLEQE